MEIRPSYPPSACLAPGRKNVAIKQLQVVLKSHGHYTGPIDGFHGALTAAAIRKFQLTRPVLWRHFGRVSRRTWDALFQT